MSLRFVAMTFVVCAVTGCAGAQPAGRKPAGVETAVAASVKAEEPMERMEALSLELSSLAEMERRGQYASGLGLYESGLRERSADKSGAVFAAYKELVYEYCRGAISAAEIEERLSRLEESAARGVAGGEDVLSAISAIRIYRRGTWEEAVPALEAFGATDGQADSFADWMALAAAIEARIATDQDMERYSLMQARYGLLPEYWYRFCRAPEQAELKRDSAERCVALAPSGPLAADAREELAESYGLGRKAGASLLTHAEIDELARRVGRTGDVAALAAMLPILNLPDNPLTLYAVGTLRELCAMDGCREWLRETAAASRGRTAERLRYAAGQ